MTSRAPAQCLSCVRLHVDEPPAGIPGSLPPVRACEAFPSGIPLKIAAYGADHREPRGDEVGGLTYEQADGERAVELFEAWRLTFAPSDRETAERRLAMDEPVTFTRPPDALL